MKWHWDNIKLIMGLLVVGSLFAFTNQRNATRELRVEDAISFGEGTQLFINYQVVNKLLIQKGKHVRNLQKDALDLSKLEYILNTNPLIQKAQVYLAVNGQLGVRIVQKKPIARVIADGSFYIDDTGKMMPLSDNYSARVIVVTGNVTEKAFDALHELVTYMRQDDFLNKHFVEIQVQANNELVLVTRTHQYEVIFGTVSNKEKKFRNYKAFYQKIKKEQALARYSTVNLEFNSQVVCTKK